MKPNYKNWMPKGMIQGTLGGAVACLILFFVFGVSGLLEAGTLKTILKIVFLILTIVLTLLALWMWLLYRAFSYDGRRQMSHQIIDGVAAKVVLPEGGCGLDVGCGSDALTIAVAKCNPQARITGIDRWGVEYSSFSKTLCEENAKAEGVTNTSIAKGDALKLDFADETFDAVCSNYVYGEGAFGYGIVKGRARPINPKGKASVGLVARFSGSHPAKVKQHSRPDVAVPVATVRRGRDLAKVESNNLAT